MPRRLRTILPFKLPPLSLGIRRLGPSEPTWKADSTTVFVANLSGFSSNSVTRVSLHDGTTICKRRKTDGRRLARLNLRGWPQYTPTLDPFVVTTRVGEVKRYEEGEAEAGRRFHNATMALRLLKQGRFDLYGAVAFQPGVRFSERWPVFVMPGRTRVGRRSDEYRFERRDKADFRGLYRGLSNNTEGARLACRRFDMAYERETVEDRLVDSWVALESLFAKRGESELRYRFAMRIAYFLEPHPDRRRDLFKTTYAAYQVRSDILHGSVTEKNMNDADQVSADVLRRSLRKIVLGGEMPDLDLLDNGAATGTHVGALK